jgi:hypothetical protein
MSAGSSTLRVPARASVATLLTALALASRVEAEAPPIHIHGILDVALASRGPATESNVLERGDSPLDGYGVRLFIDAGPTDRLTVFTQLVLRDATPLYVDGAYALFTPWPSRDLHLMAGKIPWPIGTWAPRTYSNKNPLVGTPLMYQYHTSLLWYDVPANADQILAMAGRGQYGVGYAFPGGRGMAIVDDSYWDVGAVVTGSARPFEFAGGAVAGTPGWGSTSLEENDGKTVLGRIGLAPAPLLRIGFSAAYGPYLHEKLNPRLPTGKTGNDYHQVLLMGDLALEYGHASLIAEAFSNTWETPTVGDLDARGGYVEAKLTLAPGLYAAGRGDALRFGDLTDSGGASRSWDRDLDRLEAGLGYRLDRGTLVKLVWQRDAWLAHGASARQSYDLIAAQLSVAF